MTSTTAQPDPGSPVPSPGGLTDVTLASALAQLDLTLGGPSGPGWSARAADDAEFFVTFTPVREGAAWEPLRDRVTRLMAVRHEHLVPLLGAVPVPGTDPERPRGVVLVWEGHGGVRLGDLAQDAALAPEHVVGALVAAGRAIAALHACALSPGRADVVTELRVGADGDLRHLPEPSLEVMPGLGDDAGQDVRALARAGHGLLARFGTPDDAARDLGHLLAAIGLDPQTPPPAAGTFAAMCLEIRLPALPTSWAALVSPPGEGVGDAAPAVAPPPEASVTLATVDDSARAWREHIERQPRPTQGRRRAVVPGASPAASPAAGRASSPRRDENTTGSLRGMLPAQSRGGRRAVRRTGVVLAAVLVCGATLGALQLRGPALADGTGSPRPAQASSSTPAAGPTSTPAGAPSDDGAERPDPAAAAAELTTRRAALLRGVRPAPADGLAARRDELASALATIHAAGPSLAQDTALVERLLSGESTLPDVTTEVVTTSVADTTADAASVDVDYRIVDAWGTAQERRVRLGLVWEGSTWRTTSVTAPPG